MPTPDAHGVLTWGRTVCDEAKGRTGGRGWSLLGKLCGAGESWSPQEMYPALGAIKNPGVVLKHDVLEKQESQTGVMMCGGLRGGGVPGKWDILTTYCF